MQRPGTFLCWLLADSDGQRLHCSDTRFHTKGQDSNIAHFQSQNMISHVSTSATATTPVHVVVAHRMPWSELFDCPHVQPQVIIIYTRAGPAYESQWEILIW